MGPNGRPGASLYGWAEYFPNASIYGADIDTNILFNTDRIRTYYCDQRKPNVIENMWRNPDLATDFDIIIEDGLHSFSANICFFDNSIHKLAVGGYYIIEDIIKDEIHLFVDVIETWKIKHSNLTFNLISIPCLINDYDNTVLVVKRIA